MPVVGFNIVPDLSMIIVRSILALVCFHHIVSDQI